MYYGYPSYVYRKAYPGLSPVFWGGLEKLAFKPEEDEFLTPDVKRPPRFASPPGSLPPSPESLLPGVLRSPLSSALLGGGIGALGGAGLGPLLGGGMLLPSALGGLGGAGLALLLRQMLLERQKKRIAKRLK